MDFTREPIIETIITPKEGYKLCVRSSKSGSQEEYLVDAVEVVSFGHSFFFRCLERPKCFLVPASDYEVLEVRETRVVLKNASVERTIKIGGGREPKPVPREIEAAPLSEEEVPAQEAAGDNRLDRRRDRRRGRHRRRQDDRHIKTEEGGTPSGQSAEGGGAHDETQVSSSIFTTLIPPPTRLISETIARYKDQQSAEGPISESVEKETPEDDQ